jgi:hypothetical protein
LHETGETFQETSVSVFVNGFIFRTCVESRARGAVDRVEPVDPVDRMDIVDMARPAASNRF